MSDYEYNMFADKIGLREKRIRELDTVALVEEFKDKKSGNVSLIRSEMQNRYKEGRDCDIIAEAFNASSDKDLAWVKLQERGNEDPNTDELCQDKETIADESSH